MVKRIQRRRTKGWRMPPNTIYVGRPSKWGNPHTFRGRCLQNVCGKRHERRHAVEHYRADLRAGYLGVWTVRRELKGKNLACWCPLDQPCHADVLLEIAND